MGRLIIYAAPVRRQHRPRPDGHLCKNLGEKRPEGVTLLMAIYGPIVPLCGPQFVGDRLSPRLDDPTHLAAE
jgi:hypothetical protein